MELTSDENMACRQMIPGYHVLYSVRMVQKDRCFLIIEDEKNRRFGSREHKLLGMTPVFSDESNGSTITKALVELTGENKMEWLPCHGTCRTGALCFQIGLIMLSLSRKKEPNELLGLLHLDTICLLNTQKHMDDLMDLVKMTIPLLLLEPTLQAE